MTVLQLKSRFLRKRVSLIMLFSFLCLYALAQNFPDVTEYAVDGTGTLSESELQSLRSDLSNFHKEKGSQIVVVMIATTEDYAIEDYTNRLFRKLQIGRKEFNDGILMLIAKDDRTMRIEVGYGLEGAVPDIMAKQIIDERITPAFKNDHYFDGIQDGVSALEALVRGENLPPPKLHMHITNLGIAAVIMLLTGFILGVLGGLGKISWKNGLLTVLCVAIICCLISSSFIPLFFSPFLMFPVLFGYAFGSSKTARIILSCIILYILAGIILRNSFGVHLGELYFIFPIGFGFISFIVFAVYSGITSKDAPHSRGSSSGWHSYSDSSSSSWSSSSSSSDSFSGGGGSSGGGGASGSW